MKLSLGRKIMLLVILVAVVLSLTCLAVSGITNRKTMESEYSITADSLAATAAVLTDGDQLERITNKVVEIYQSSTDRMSTLEADKDGYSAYLAQYSQLMEDPDYLALQSALRKFQDPSEADCVYTLCVQPKDKTLIYIVDAAYDDELVPPGSFDLVEESCYRYLGDLTQGFPAFITNTKEYGYVVTSCAPVYNSAGEVVCFMAVDLSMNEVLETENKYTVDLAILLFAMTFIICHIALVYVKKQIIKPINMLSEAAGQYNTKQFKNSHNEFGAITIHTGDELEILLGSMKQMEKDIDSYIDNLTQTRELLSNARQQADDMHELAHMDALTGIRNKMAYDKEIDKLDEEILEGFQEFGIAMIDLNFLKNINDTYGHECGNISIKRLSRLICEVFSHSPVFRIGGDEFAVILKNSDYEHILSLTNTFNDRLQALSQDDSLEAWEKISAAIGYAMFDAQHDRRADDVFERADQMMYNRKKEMKALRS